MEIKQAKCHHPCQYHRYGTDQKDEKGQAQIQSKGKLLLRTMYFILHASPPYIPTHGQ